MPFDRGEGYCIVPSYILKLENLSSTKKLLLGRIFSLANNNREGYCFASNAYLGENVGLKSSSVSRNLSELEDLGFIDLDKKASYVPNDTNRAIYPQFPKNKGEGVRKSEREGTQNRKGGYAKSKPPYNKDNNRGNNRVKFKGYEDEVREVFEFWRDEREDALDINAGARKPQLSDKRIRKIRKRLEDGYSVEDLKNAVRGCLSNDFNVNRGFVQIDLIFRNEDKVDQYLQWNRNAEKEDSSSDHPGYEDLN